MALRVLGRYAAYVALTLFLASSQLQPIKGHEQKRLDCSSVDPVNLDIFHLVCAGLTTTGSEPGAENKDNTLMERLDLVQKCGCGLMRHGLVWQALYSHETEILYYSLQEFVRSKDDTEASKEIRASVMFDDDSDDKMYFWDRLSSILSTGQDQANAIGKEIRNIFAKSYYDSDTFTMPFAANQQSLKVGKLISTTCNNLVSNIGEFLKYFSALINVSQNSRFVYRLASYDSTLYKLIGVTKACQFMKLTGQIA